MESLARKLLVCWIFIGLVAICDIGYTLCHKEMFDECIDIFEINPIAQFVYSKFGLIPSIVLRFGTVILSGVAVAVIYWRGSKSKAFWTTFCIVLIHLVFAAYLWSGIWYE